MDDEPKFRRGDHVRCVRLVYEARVDFSFLLGMTGVVSGRDEYGGLWVDASDGHNYTFSPLELEHTDR